MIGLVVLLRVVGASLRLGARLLLRPYRVSSPATALRVALGCSACLWVEGLAVTILLGHLLGIDLALLHLLEIFKNFLLIRLDLLLHELSISHQLSTLLLHTDATEVLLFDLPLHLHSSVLTGPLVLLDPLELILAVEVVLERLLAEFALLLFLGPLDLLLLLLLLLDVELALVHEQLLVLLYNLAPPHLLLHLLPSLLLLLLSVTLPLYLLPHLQLLHPIHEDLLSLLFSLLVLDKDLPNLLVLALSLDLLLFELPLPLLFEFYPLLLGLELLLVEESPLLLQLHLLPLDSLLDLLLTNHLLLHGLLPLLSLLLLQLLSALHLLLLNFHPLLLEALQLLLELPLLLLLDLPLLLLLLDMALLGLQFPLEFLLLFLLDALLLLLVLLLLHPLHSLKLLLLALPPQLIVSLLLLLCQSPLLQELHPLPLFALLLLEQLLLVLFPDLLHLDLVLHHLLDLLLLPLLDLLQLSALHLDHGAGLLLDAGPHLRVLVAASSLPLGLISLIDQLLSLRNHLLEQLGPTLLEVLQALLLILRVGEHELELLLAAGQQVVLGDAQLHHGPF